MAHNWWKFNPALTLTQLSHLDLNWVEFQPIKCIGLFGLTNWSIALIQIGCSFAQGQMNDRRWNFSYNSHFTIEEEQIDRTDKSSWLDKSLVCNKNIRERIGMQVACFSFVNLSGHQFLFVKMGKLSRSNLNSYETSKFRRFSCPDFRLFCCSLRLISGLFCSSSSVKG